MEPRKEEPKSRFQIGKLEERIAPSHLNPGPDVVVVPVGGTPGENGIEISLDAPANHARPLRMFGL